MINPQATQSEQGPPPLSRAPAQGQALDEGHGPWREAGVQPCAGEPPITVLAPDEAQQAFSPRFFDRPCGLKGE